MSVMTTAPGRRWQCTVGLGMAAMGAAGTAVGVLVGKGPVAESGADDRLVAGIVVVGLATAAGAVLWRRLLPGWRGAVLVVVALGAAGICLAAGAPGLSALAEMTGRWGWMYPVMFIGLYVNGLMLLGLLSAETAETGARA